ncbi:MAG TPA: hypothetical protein VGN12_18560 [Pirellulales bacterium]|jgi:hypothetical protein
MTMFDTENFQWRETYFVLFRSAKRPTLAKVEATLRELGSHYQLADMQAGEGDTFESLTLFSPDDFAALDISYLAGEDVQDQVASLVEELRPGEGVEPAKLALLPKCDARFDVMHFEQMIGNDAGEEADEMLDPSTLLLVLEALVELTGGVGIDPQSGSLM